MTRFSVNSESDKISEVILGIAEDWDSIPTAEECYDPHSLESVERNQYPTVENVRQELEEFRKVLEKHCIKVIRPKPIRGVNQVFARDISFVINDKLVIPHIIKDRQKELEGIKEIINSNSTDIIRMPEGAFAEGGDVMVWHNYIFIGYSDDKIFDQYKVARTNSNGVDFLERSFPNKTFKRFQLRKSDTDPRANTLHLDCAFQPIGSNKAILHPGSFLNQEESNWLISLFGEENIFIINDEEAYHLFPNIFSINPNTVVSNSSFVRLNTQLKKWGFRVEEVSYDNIARMGGLLRCTTHPLKRSTNKQTTSEIIMVRPASFRMNEETVVNNYYQKTDTNLNPNEIKAKAIEEFDAFLEKLKSSKVNVNVIQDTDEPSTPDALFPNNWISFHQNGNVSLYPMFANNRRLERRNDIFDQLSSMGFKYENTIDLTDHESQNNFLEGTGSLVLDRENRIAYAAISQRTNSSLVDEFCDKLGYRAVKFGAMQTVNGKREPIYHTNVMMCIGSNLAIICLDCIDNKEERENLKINILDTKKTLIELSENQINQFAGNMLEVKSTDGKDLLIMSSQAHESLNQKQIDIIEQYCEIVSSPLYLIEQLGGGSARCMIAENFLPKLGESSC